MDLLKTMIANRQAQGITNKMASTTISSPAQSRKSSKHEIIEKKPKHKKVKVHFESIIDRACDENESESE
jgi:hypothetical protein